MDYYKIIISPETIQRDLTTVTLSGQTYGVYSAMTEILSGNTNGTSLLTGLTIPILITENVNDMGYYEPFDGDMIQKDVVTNFLFSSTTTNPYDVYVYNTSDEYQKFLELSTYTIDWGDGTTPQTVTTFSPNYVMHSYPFMMNNYTITLTQVNPWGTIKVSKKINLPFTIPAINNPKGTAYFLSNSGGWSGTPISYDYIFSGDSENNVTSQVSSDYVITPFYVSGETVSKLQDLEQYGSVKYIQGKNVYKNREFYGVINSITSTYTGYTIQNVDYYDYNDGTTIFFALSSGFTVDNITAEPITKQEIMMGVIDQPQIQTNVYVERGKNSAYEKIQRLGEVDNLGDLINYGYGFFKVEKKI